MTATFSETPAGFTLALMPEAMDRRLLEVERLVWDGDAVRLGEFRCPTQHRLFADSGSILNHVFVFPRTAVALQHEGAREFVSGPNLATLYNRGARYRRRPVDREGDVCDWIQMRDDVVAEVLAASDPSVAERPAAPFRTTHVPSPARVYLRQRKLFRYASTHPWPDPLRIEEEAIAILRELTRSEPRAGSQPRPGGRTADLAEAARTLLERRGGRDVSLSKLAGELSTSVFHLCRAFRATTGFSIYDYAHHLRLRRALERLESGSGDLLSIALDAEYSSHSHFTAAFRRRFGVTPSQVRRELAGEGGERREATAGQRREARGEGLGTRTPA